MTMIQEWIKIITILCQLIVTFYQKCQHEPILKDQATFANIGSWIARSVLHIWPKCPRTKYPLTTSTLEMSAYNISRPHQVSDDRILHMTRAKPQHTLRYLADWMLDTVATSMGSLCHEKGRDSIAHTTPTCVGLLRQMIYSHPATQQKETECRSHSPLLCMSTRKAVQQTAH